MGAFLALLASTVMLRSFILSPFPHKFPMLALGALPALARALVLPRFRPLHHQRRVFLRVDRSEAQWALILHLSHDIVVSERYQTLTLTQKAFSVLTHRQWRIAAMISCTLTFMLFSTGCSANWATESTNLLTVMAGIFNSILNILTIAGVKVTSQLSATFNSDVTEVENEITAVAPLVTAYENTPSSGALSKLTTALNLIKTNSAGLLAGITQLSAAWQTKIGAIISLGVDTEEEITSLIPSPTATVADLHEHYAKAKLFFSKSPAKKLKDAYNTLIETPTGDAEVDAVFAQVHKL
jgi:hypothetical protein